MGDGTVQPRRTVTRRLARDQAAIVDARRMVVEQLRDWGIAEELIDEIALTAHELVANAFVHAVPPVDLRIIHAGSELIVEVDDRSPDRPQRRYSEPDAEHGRGLQVVEALATQWGSRLHPTTKTVWSSHEIPTE
jgi:anti-sigma regulatory factor (Ser/Thr protein kinase)